MDAGQGAGKRKVESSSIRNVKKACWVRPLVHLGRNPQMNKYRMGTPGLTAPYVKRIWGVFVDHKLNTAAKKGLMQF